MRTPNNPHLIPSQIYNFKKVAHHNNNNNLYTIHFPIHVTLCNQQTKHFPLELRSTAYHVDGVKFHKSPSGGAVLITGVPSFPDK